jgi:hypothetical protein
MAAQICSNSAKIDPIALKRARRDASRVWGVKTPIGRAAGSEQSEAVKGAKVNPNTRDRRPAGDCAGERGLLPPTASSGEPPARTTLQGVAGSRRWCQSGCRYRRRYRPRPRPLKRGAGEKPSQMDPRSPQQRTRHLSHPPRERPAASEICAAKASTEHPPAIFLGADPARQASTHLGGAVLPLSITRGTNPQSTSCGVQCLTESRLSKAPH